MDISAGQRGYGGMEDGGACFGVVFYAVFALIYFFYMYVHHKKPSISSIHCLTCGNVYGGYMEGWRQSSMGFGHGEQGDTG